MENYLDATVNLYRDAALTPDVGLCVPLPNMEISWFRNSKK
jgi:hypothetical protein